MGSSRLERFLLSPVPSSTPVVCFGYDNALIQVHGLSGGDSIAVQGSCDKANFVTLSGINLNSNASLSSITADGVYAYQALELLQWTQTGSASTPTVTLLLKV